MSVWFWIGQGALLVWCVINICIALQQRHEEKIRCGCGIRGVFNHGSRKHQRQVKGSR